ncbi:MAG TPA: outer membrane protein assembly factor BamD [Arachidicoccus sp.]|nr:outer membrane protein assembly factor BamD [Arachidicoccus sp.]
MKRIFQISLVGLFLILSSCASKYSKILNSKDNELRLKKAQQYYQDKKYAHAQELFQDLFPYLRGTPRYEDAFYKFAYSAYYLKDYESSSLAFQTFTESFPNSALVPDASYMQGYTLFMSSPKSELDQTPTHKAIGILKSFINSYPKSDKVDEAKKLIDQCNEKLEVKEYLSAQLYYDLGYYRASHLYFDLLLSDYPASKRADQYMFMIAQSSYDYAKVSVPSAQVERYQQTIDDCTNFLGQYPASQFKEKAEKMQKDSQEQITKIKKLQNEQTQKTS